MNYIIESPALVYTLPHWRVLCRFPQAVSLRLLPPALLRPLIYSSFTEARAVSTSKFVIAVPFVSTAPGAAFSIFAGLFAEIPQFGLVLTYSGRDLEESEQGNHRTSHQPH
jgi:hypothetical protein